MAVLDPKTSKVSPLNEDFAKLVHSTLEKWHIQGVAIAVIDGDETWTKVCSQQSLQRP